MLQIERCNWGRVRWAVSVRCPTCSRWADLRGRIHVDGLIERGRIECMNHPHIGPQPIRLLGWADQRLPADLDV